MSSRPPTKPRKHATQERSRATVDALIEATARILVTEGFDKASTNRIAAVAGVSIGSLYQYFPGKEALVVAVAQRHRSELDRTARETIAETRADSLEQRMTALVIAAFKAHRVAPELHRVLAEEIPRVGALEQVGNFNRDHFAFFRGYLERHESEIRVADLDTASFICVTTIEALTHNAVLHHADMLSNEQMQALVGETTRLIMGYLVG